MADGGYIPSFCTGCYRKGRVGQDFMDLAKPGLIKQYCMPNALFTFKEYLEDFASPETKAKGFKLINKLVREVENNTLQTKISGNLVSIQEGQRDIYF
jgi:2-iminoacetate synthase